MAALDNPMVDRAKVVAAFRNLKAGPLPSKTLIYSIIAIVNDRSGDEPPFNRFFDDDLREAYAKLYRLLRIHVQFWRNTLESIEEHKKRVLTGGQTYHLLEEYQEDLEPLIRDAEMIMKAPAFYHRMSEANQRGKDNVRGNSPINKMRMNLIELIQTAGYKQAQARQVALYLFPTINVNDPTEALKKAVQRQKRKGR